MSLKFVCLFVFGFILSSGFAQETPPINKYFIILTPYQSPGKIIKEGKRIFVRDSFGNKQRGIIRITSDTTLVIENLFGTIKDSFNIHELIQVRRTGPIRSIFGVYLVVAGGMHIALSTLFFGRSELGDIVGAYFLTVGVLASTGGIVMLHGKSFKKKHGYTYKIYHAKGFKLKRKHLPYLFPLH